MVFDRTAVAKALATLANKNVYLGTSSWKYPGWLGQLYDEQRYLWRGKLAKTRFEKHCLEEYAEVFKTVCVDAAYYQFPQPATIDKLMAQVPDDFLFSFKVTDEITVKHFTKLPRYGARAGQPNEHFLNVDLFQEAFLTPLQKHHNQVGLLIFEFSRLHKRAFRRGREFVAMLDEFLAHLPRDWQYGVEVRNRSLLNEAYFQVLARHGVAHVYNQWQRMPPVSEQLANPESWTQPAFTGARFLLTPGRPYQEAVDTFSPYDSVQVVDEDARQAGAEILRRSFEVGSAKPTVVYVNNRLEGNSLGTIMAMLEKLGLLKTKPVTFE